MILPISCLWQSGWNKLFSPKLEIFVDKGLLPVIYLKGWINRSIVWAGLQMQTRCLVSCLMPQQRSVAEFTEGFRSFEFPPFLLGSVVLRSRVGWKTHWNIFLFHFSVSILAVWPILSVIWQCFKISEQFCLLIEVIKFTSTCWC